MAKLIFAEANAKTRRLYGVPELAPYLQGRKEVYSLDMPSGYTCPGANLCKSMAVVGENGKATIQDGPACQFRCFAASQEVLYPPCRKNRHHNMALIRGAKGSQEIAKLILASLPHNAGVVRLHVGGDFFRLAYLKAMIQVAKSRPDVLFYGYTKSLHFVKRVGGASALPPNLRLTLSIGGKYDSLIPQLVGMRTVKVVLTEEEAQKEGLELDHDDSKAVLQGGNFALLVHGSQPAGSVAGKMVYRYRRKMGGFGQYGR